MFMGRCTHNPEYRYIVQEKKIPITVRIPMIEIQKIADTVTVVHKSPDSTAINGLIAVRDSLRLELAKRNVGVLFGLDTITPLRDTIQVTCDEIHRRVMARIRFGVRDTTVVYLDTTTILPPKRLYWGISAGVGAAVTIENSLPMLRPAFFIGLTYSFINF
jgi:hypothetical protein